MFSMYSNLIYKIIDHPDIDKFIGAINRKVLYLYLAWGFPITILVVIAQEMGYKLIVKVFILSVFGVWAILGIAIRYSSWLRGIFIRSGSHPERAKHTLNFIAFTGFCGLAMGVFI